ncbi:nucleoside triphosphate pyrophosphohydrolase [Sphingomonas sp.]|jgi:ATP diphosphatase|uniref:nucleoside triphosphate pyrophosphohydrolase n=1 Tax=Sphingomonas sp. TaxID=28214 RepID=UPI002DE46637|nr:nucleoside triphosphate pyrophosphohydrolase [Sphingomonas sp.]
MDEKSAPLALQRLAAIMARLRDPERGCEWDVQQTFATIAPYTIEEAYEVADAIERDDLDALKDELGDLALQVVFHARMAEELGRFDLADVLTAVSDKMERRHPHVFGDGASPGWEAVKAAERAGKDDPSALAGVASALPALLRAEKLQKRAALTGFDWPDASGAREKILEELDEIASALPEALEEEVGDLLFAVANFARHLKIDPEAALRKANAKFEQRFRTMEEMDVDFVSRTLDEKEALWRQAKERA